MDSIRRWRSIDCRRHIRNDLDIKKEKEEHFALKKEIIKWILHNN